jgi:hypothetical protein
MGCPAKNEENKDFGEFTLMQSTRNGLKPISRKTQITGKMTEAVLKSAHLLGFLKKLPCHRRRDRRSVLVLDNARFHHATRLQPFLAETGHDLPLLFLHPYSPELNLKRV